MTTLVNYPVNTLPAKVARSAYSKVSTVKHIGLPFHKNRSDLLGRSLRRAGSERTTINGQTRNHRSSHMPVTAVSQDKRTPYKSRPKPRAVPGGGCSPRGGWPAAISGVGYHVTPSLSGRATGRSHTGNLRSAGSRPGSPGRSSQRYWGV